MANLSDAAVLEMLSGRHIGSLATQNADSTTHMVAVWYYFDGESIYVATAGYSRKAKNVKRSSQVSLMIDARDLAAQRGICITGTAQLLTGPASSPWNEKVHRKYLSTAALADPKVGPVFAQWDDVTIQITPSSVIAWDLREADSQAFGGALASNPEYLLPLDR